MKRLFLFLGFLLCLFSNAHAVFDSTSNGSDGAFNPPSQVPAGTTVDGNTVTVPLPDTGIFNWTTVNVPSGYTVKFTKNAANTPVYMLAQGEVTISGTIDASGGAGGSSTIPGIGGPGGYDGGYGGATYTRGGKGLGPGGGDGGPDSGHTAAGGGGFGTIGGSFSGGNGAGGPTYANAQLMPLIGGSGGGGEYGSSTTGHGGGGGGGAILIASSTSIAIYGTVKADGGGVTPNAGGGSGGGIRLISDTISGPGVITAKGGQLTSSNRGGKGRIRIEAYTNNFSNATDPPYTYGAPGSVFPNNDPAIVPTLSIESIAGNVPPSRTGSYSVPDMSLSSETSNPVAVVVNGAHVPVGTTVTVSAIPQYGSPNTGNATLSGTTESSTGTANVTLSTEYVSVITAQATFLMQQAMYWEGEKIDNVRLAATMGGRSEAVYITESGKEIPSGVLIAAGMLNR